MPRAQCYYEILGVSETASGDEIKKAYRNLALVWHPDKNQTNAEEAHVKFQAILKAYETLSDTRERDWYDRHKDLILSGDGDDANTELVNLFQYYSSSCYANINDDEDGFYTVYRKLFETIAEEEKTATSRQCQKSSKNKKIKESDEPELPSFGYSDSPYDEVVKPFYAFWSGFCTRLTFDNLDKYKTTEAENRRVLRLMEKENNKVKEQARKERNGNVRKLVEFIKKRDKRLKAQALLIEQQNQFNRDKTAEKQRQQREKLLKESAVYKPTAWENMNDIELQLQQLEDEYDNIPKRKNKNQRGRVNIGTTSEGSENEATDADGEPADDLANNSKCDQPDDVCDDDDDDDDDIGELICQACNKGFQSIGAFENHEASKKHKQNVLKLAKILKQEESLLKRK